MLGAFTIKYEVNGVQQFVNCCKSFSSDYQQDTSCSAVTISSKGPQRGFIAKG